MLATFLGSGSDVSFGLQIAPDLWREIGLVSVVFILSAAQGALLATRFRVLVLLPFVCINVAVIAFAWAASHSHDIDLLIEQVLVSGVAIQVGYLADQVGIKGLRLR